MCRTIAIFMDEDRKAFGRHKIAPVPIFQAFGELLSPDVAGDDRPGLRFVPRAGHDRPAVGKYGEKNTGFHFSTD